MGSRPRLSLSCSPPILDAIDAGAVSIGGASEVPSSHFSFFREGDTSSYLVTSKNRVHIRSSGIDKLVLSHDEDVKEALWCTLTFGEKERCLAILLQSTLRLRRTNGESIDLPLPCSMKAIWATHWGLLLERDVTVSTANDRVALMRPSTPKINPSFSQRREGLGGSLRSFPQLERSRRLASPSSPSSPSSANAAEQKSPTAFSLSCAFDEIRPLAEEAETGLLDFFDLAEGRILAVVLLDETTSKELHPPANIVFTGDEDGEIRAFLLLPIEERGKRAPAVERKIAVRPQLRRSRSSGEFSLLRSTTEVFQSLADAEDSEDEDIIEPQLYLQRIWNLCLALKYFALDPDREEGARLDSWDVRSFTFPPRESPELPVRALLRVSRACWLEVAIHCEGSGLPSVSVLRRHESAELVPIVILGREMIAYPSFEGEYRSLQVLYGGSRVFDLSFGARNPQQEWSVKLSPWEGPCFALQESAVNEPCLWTVPCDCSRSKLVLLGLCALEDGLRSVPDAFVSLLRRIIKEDSALRKRSTADWAESDAVNVLFDAIANAIWPQESEEDGSSVSSGAGEPCSSELSAFQRLQELFDPNSASTRTEEKSDEPSNVAEPWRAAVYNLYHVIEDYQLHGLSMALRRSGSAYERYLSRLSKLAVRCRLNDLELACGALLMQAGEVKRPSSVPNSLAYLEGMLRGKSNFVEYRTHPWTPVASKLIPLFRLIKLLLVSPATERPAILSTIVQSIASLGGRSEALSLSNIAAPLRLVLLEVLSLARDRPPENMPSEAYILIDREDLALEAAVRELLGTEAYACEPSDSHRIVRLPQVEQLARNLGIALMQTLNLEYKGEGPDGERLAQTRQSSWKSHVSDIVSLRFPNDRRIDEVAALLSSDQPLPVIVERRPEMGDVDLIRAQQARLRDIVMMTLCRSIGRSAWELGSLSVQNPVERLPIKPLCLRGRLETGAQIELKKKNLGKGTLDWPSFFSGVAASLSLASSSPFPLTQTWIQSQRPPVKKRVISVNSEETYESARLAMIEHAGLLYGIGLRGHLNALNSAGLYTYLATDDVFVKIGVILGIAASRIKSADILPTKTLLLHIRAVSNLDVPTEAQCAAVVGLGLVFFETRTRSIVEILLRERERVPLDWVESKGALREDDSSQGIDGSQRDSYILSVYFSLGLVLMGSEGGGPGLEDLRIGDQLEKACYCQSHVKVPGDREGRRVGIAGQVGMPGAIIALGMIYFKSGDKKRAACLALPELLYEYEAMHASTVFLRCLSRGLILWDQVTDSDSWLEDELPPVLRLALEWNGVPSGQSVDVAGARLEEIVMEDEMLAFSCAVYAKTGLFFALALKTAGTGHDGATKGMLSFLNYLYRELDGKRKSRLSGNAVEFRDTVCTCIALVCSFLGVVCAGTGRLDVLRALRKATMREDKGFSYGHHMMVSMGIGFLFMGGAMTSFSSSSNLSIASLIIALYPRLPEKPTACRYHLQALRYLWVLAAERRSVDAISLTDGKRRVVDVVVELTDSAKELTLATPCVLPPTHLIAAIRLQSPDHEPFRIMAKTRFDALRIASGLPYYLKPRPRVSVGSKSGGSSSAKSPLLRFVEQSSASPSERGAKPDGQPVTFRSDLNTFLSHIALHYSTSAAHHISSAIMEVWEALRRPTGLQSTECLKVARAYYERATQSEGQERCTLLLPHLISSLFNEVSALELAASTEGHRKEAEDALTKLVQQGSTQTVDEAARFLARLDIC